MMNCETSGTMESPQNLDPAAVPIGVLKVIERLWLSGYEAYLVGGSVRDQLLGRSATDWDLATSAEPAEVMAIFERVVPTGIDHGTVTVVDGDATYEVTTFRIESEYSDGRRPDAVAYTRSIEADLGRRDFTVNALAWDPRQGALVDPYGGQADLRRRIIRAVGPAHERLGEDGLRSMRAIRFACVLDFEIDGDVVAAIGATIDTFRQVSVERIEVELRKTLLSNHPGRGLRLLAETGLLAEVDQAFGAWSGETLVDVAEALDRSQACPVVRYGVVLARLDNENDGARRVLNRLKVSKKFRGSVEHTLKFGGRLPNAPLDDAGLRRWVAQVGRDGYDAVLGLLMARFPDFDGVEFERRARRVGAFDGPHTIKELTVSGRELMTQLGMRPSPQLGVVLNSLLEACWVDPSVNEPVALLALAKAQCEEAE